MSLQTVSASGKQSFREQLMSIEQRICCIPELYSFGCSCFMRAFLSSTLHFCASRYISSCHVNFWSYLVDINCMHSTVHSYPKMLHCFTGNTSTAISTNLISILQYWSKKATLECNSHSNVDTVIVGEALSISAASIYYRVLGERHSCRLHQQHCLGDPLRLDLYQTQFNQTSMVEV